MFDHFVATARMVLHGCPNCAPNVDRATLGAQNLWRVSDFSGAHTLPFKKKPDLQIFSRIDKAMKNVQRIPNTIAIEH